MIGGRLLLWVIAAAAMLAGAYALERHVEQRGYDRAEAVYTAAIERLHADAAATLADQPQRTQSAEQALNEAKNNQELKNAPHQKTIVDLSGRLRTAAGPAARLHDPNATPCRGSGGGPAPDAAPAPGAGATDPAEAGGLLSEPLTELLQRLTRDADDINAAYVSCRADAYTVRQTP